MTNRFERFTLAISEISQCWHKIAYEEMKAYNLKGAYAVYLLELYRHSEGITAAQLCELCAKDKAEISRAVSLLEKRGLAIRENVNNNSYRALIKLTDNGKEAAMHVRSRADIAVDAGGHGISVEEREIFYKILEQIASNLKTISREGLSK